MPGRFQRPCGLLLLMAGSGAAPAPPTPAPPAPPPPFAPATAPSAAPAPIDRASATRRLRADCDALLRQVVRKPYGWALPAPGRPAFAPPDAPKAPVLPRDAVIISLDPLATPAAALLLHEAGRLLDEPVYADAARRLARGMAACQHSTGRFPARAVFTSRVEVRENPGPVPGRAPTLAALAALLTIATDAPDDEPLRRAAARAAGWLARQQPPTGGWPTLFDPAADVGPDLDSFDAPGARPAPAPVRLFRLDQADFRDSTFALLLAGDALDDAFLRRSAGRSIDLLLRVRVGPASRTAGGLWHAAYELDGSPSERLPLRARTLDTVACRHALQALLAHHLLAGDAPSLDALRTASAALAGLRFPDGRWQRLYPLRAGEVRIDTKAPAPPPHRNPFEPLPPLAEDLAALDAFDLPPVLEAIARVERSGPEAFRRDLARTGGLRRHLARAVLGLEEQPLLVDSPLAPATSPEGEHLPALLRRIDSAIATLRSGRP